MNAATRFRAVSALLIMVSACDRPAQSSGSGRGAPPPASEPPRPSSNPQPSTSPSASAAPETASAHASPTTSFDSDPVGAPSPSFEAVVGDWYVFETDKIRGLKVDGAKWRNGVPSASLADQAKRLYGDRYAEFLDGVKAFAFFPLAVWKGDCPSGDLRISFKFYPQAGRIDQGAGIAWSIAPDGSYWGARANAL